MKYLAAVAQIQNSSLQYVEALDFRCLGCSGVTAKSIYQIVCLKSTATTSVWEHLANLRLFSSQQERNTSEVFPKCLFLVQNTTEDF